MRLTCTYIVAMITGIATINSCHVTATIIVVVVAISITAATTKAKEKGISKSKILISEDACISQASK